MLDVMMDLLGWTGTTLFVVSYYLISTGRLQATGTVYQCMNLVGAFCLGANVFYKRAWPALGLEVIWAVIAIQALVSAQKTKSQK